MFGRQPGLLRELRSHTLAILLLVVTLVLVTTAAMMASQTARRYREFTTRALTEFAVMGAWNFSIRSFAGFEELALTYARFEGLRPSATGPDVGRISQQVDSLKRCSCAFYLEAIGYATGSFGDTSSIVYRPAGQRLSAQSNVSSNEVTNAAGTARYDLAHNYKNDGVLSAKLSAITKIAARPNGAEWPVVVRVGPDAGKPWILVVVPLGRSDGLSGDFLVVDLDMDDWRDRVLRRLHDERSTILPASLVGAVSNGEIAKFRLYSRAYGTVFEQPTTKLSGINASVPFDRDTALLVGIELSREVTERIVRGAIPRSNLAFEIALPFVAVLLVLAIALTVVRAERLALARSRFAASVSHELRTPLTHILLNAETLHYGRERDAADRESTAGVIAREARRLVYLVENVLQFSKAEHDVLRVRPRAVRIDLAVSELADSWSALVEAAGASLEIVADEAVWGEADSAALQLVLTNLLDNALHHAPGSAIRILIEKQSPHAAVTIDDDGAGIESEERARVLEPFQRSSQALVLHPKGAGIGLAVVVQLMHAMNGTLRMDSSPSGGLRVVLLLPLARAAGQEVAS